jgi:hypothetical protein
MKITFLLTCLLSTFITHARLLKVTAGTDITIISGTIFHADGLTLTPSADFIISNNDLSDIPTCSILLHLCPLNLFFKF